MRRWLGFVRAAVNRYLCPVEAGQLADDLLRRVALSVRDPEVLGDGIGKDPAHTTLDLPAA